MRTDDYYRAVCVRESEKALQSEPSPSQGDAFSAAHEFTKQHADSKVAIQHSVGPKGPWRKY